MVDEAPVVTIFEVFTYVFPDPFVVTPISWDLSTQTTHLRALADSVLTFMFEGNMQVIKLLQKTSANNSNRPVLILYCPPKGIQTVNHCRYSDPT